MSIDLTPQLLTSLAPEILDYDVIGEIHADDVRRETRFDRAMTRALGSHAIWLTPILLVQAVLSFRPSRSFDRNEATSINAGHQLLAHLLHGTPTPDYGRYFSGVPSLYSVPAALVADVGGAPLVRLVSTALALIATAFVYFATRRLFGQGAALIAAAMLGLNAFTLFMARFASADALCIALLAASLWLAVSSAERPQRALALGPCLLLASAASYLAIAFIPAVIAVLAVHTTRTAGARRGRRCVALALASVTASIAVALLAIAPGDLRGMRLTLLDRHVMTASSTAALHHQLFTDVGPLLLAAALGVLTVKNRLVAGLLALLTLLPALAQLALGTANPAHDNFGLVIVFLAPLVGAVAIAMLRRGPLLGVRAPLAITAMVVLVTAGLSGSTQLLHEWPNSYLSSPAPTIAHVGPVGIATPLE